MKYSLRRIKLEQIRYRTTQQNKKNNRIEEKKSKLKEEYWSRVKSE